MKRIVKLDPFFSDQPEKTFLSDLTSPVHKAKPSFFGPRAKEENEVCVEGLYIKEQFPDTEGLLETIYEDFTRFLTLCKVVGNTFPLRIVKGETACFEAYTIEVTENEVVITSADTEGARRALVFLEDEMMRREGPYLPLGKIERTPRLVSRITRCFFSPINRPPKYGDELSDDIDYYPEEYLNRLMHDGANGVWIYTRFSDLVKSSYLPDFGQGCESRIEKLNRTIRKCARYGIRAYVFAIEPFALTPEQAALLPEADGGTTGAGERFYGVTRNDSRFCCVNSKKGRAFVEEAGQRLFESCPGLGGLISITFGEFATGCGSSYASIPQIGYKVDMRCPRCNGTLTPGEAVAQAAAALADGIHKVNPNAEVISWTYGHRFWPLSEVRNYVRHAPGDVINMQNLEEMGYAEQLGKVRQGVDYWLSYPGPSPLFEETADEAMNYGKPMYMKTQVCCSHEVASVPYVPAPGILYDKYQAGRRLNVTGVMQCWYFGNYPSMMSKAAGELAFEHDFTDKRAFLENLAGSYFGRSRARAVADAWEAFEAGYTQFPLNIMFSYYGPMHDGPVWELHLKPRNFSLPQSWQSTDPTDGDRIGESLLSGHTLEEALILTGRMTENWQQGVQLLTEALSDVEGDQEQLSVARALNILFASGNDILSFYRLRTQLGKLKGNASEILEKMREIVLRELERDEELIALCEADGRLGYHSEAEGYKYFPKKIRHRMDCLKTMLETEFPEVEGRIAAGKAPLAYYVGEEIDTDAYQMTKGCICESEWKQIGEHSAFRAAYDKENLTIEFRSDNLEGVQLDMEFDLMWPAAPAHLNPDASVTVDSNAHLYYEVFGKNLVEYHKLWQTEALPTETGTHLRATLNREQAGWTDDLPLKMRIRSDAGEMWCVEENPVHTLGKSSVSPGEFGWLIP